MVLRSSDAATTADARTALADDFARDGGYGDDARDVERAEDRRARRRGGFWTRARRAALALGVAACACASGAAVASTARARAGASALGVQPDARGTPPPESAFVRTARKAFGAALMRASYHQTRASGDVDTAEEADALADREAMAVVVDEDFEDDAGRGDFPIAAGAGRRAGPVSELERRREARRRAHRAAARRAVARAGAATSEPPPAPPSPTPPAPARATTRGEAHRHRDGGEGGFLSATRVREAKRQHARHDRRVERRVESREEEKEEETKRDDAAEEEDAAEDRPSAAMDAYDDDEDLVEAAPSKPAEESARQKYFKSINGGYFAAPQATRDDDIGQTMRHDRAKRQGLASLHNRPGAIPGLIDHLQANGAQVGQMRLMTYTNSAYWPMAKLFIESAQRIPGLADALTVMVSDRATLKQCVATGVMCFLDTDMIDVLGEHMNEDGSIQAGQEDMSGDLGKALRVVWTWRKVHVVYTLVNAGYGCLFLDASTLLLRDPRLLIKQKLDAGALLVTLSDFGGALEQKAINTGLIGARPNEYVGKLLEDWMALEPAATDTEQASLTWNIAPNARADGVIITALSQEVAPSYLTFDVSQHLDLDEDGSGEHRGYIVHAAYCGSISGKSAFLSRVSQLAENPNQILPATEEENAGCDVFDRRKFFTCGLAPWDGVCE